MGIGVVVTSELITSVVYPSFTLVLYIKKKNGPHILVAFNGSDSKEAAGTEVGQEGDTNTKN